jgi:hypothetical protein
VFKSLIAKILIIVIFLKIMLSIDFDNFLFLDFFLSTLFDLPLNSNDKPADLLRHTSVPRHTG